MTEHSLTEGLLTFWHSYRLLFLVAFSTGFVIIRFYRKFQTRSKTTASSSVPPSPRSASPEKPDKPLLNEAVKPVATQNIESQTSLSNEPLSKAASGPKRVSGKKPLKVAGRRAQSDQGQPISFIQPIIFFASLTTTTERYAQTLLEDLRAAAQKRADLEDRERGLLPPQIHDLSYIDLDDYFTSAPKPPSNSPGTRYVYCLLIPTYNIDSILNTFLDHLNETHNDFRIDTGALSSLAGYSVFGFGDKEGWPTEEEGFCSQAKELDKWMAKLTGRKRAYPLGFGDVKSDAESALKEWSQGLQDVLLDILENGGLGEGVPGSGDAVESDEELDDEDLENGVKGNNKRRKAQDVVDLEDIKFGADPQNTTGAPVPVDFTTTKQSAPAPATEKEMVPKTSPTYAALTKQGYTIVGSHSGVKICRWTKSALRGRGSCYKFSFYGIRSHLCMEATPSLSCSNKCIFCWRHGTNPVGTTWRWKVDSPELIFQGVKEGHYKKIKMMRGVPGVRAERFAEAMRIRHCALSLVGEPIFYPHINQFLDMLHEEHISSFLVCNAQHPDQLETLHRVTQLYVSIDASNRESLRKIDRPLHRDFWERFQRCLDILREKRHVQRTVFRLTLVKGFNIDDEVIGYANLVEKALPCFIEIKGVTYCGTSTSAGAGLTMQNVPFYEEIAEFVTALNSELQRRGLDYGIAAEHAHSCCVLIASERFHVNGKWHTRIDYDRFFQLLEKEKADGTPFTPEDYMRETEDWALWGNGGFDPNDERVYRKGKKKQLQVTAEA
ncbi:flavodoxin and radical SAM domain protein [Aspergillus clavatus NRRL 1]|uniref:S-adenosyl-L-methionine-dependent tRNA 4-demethylwyosine synthase n=1 Tax=Aspergillus clavatus (strain ATCC 1007 / CBS 513.65 / DSM 816 / NCTC 3887 / NRRL 1 / QM 1276 / 107) TaxID=344612 RepID=A1CU36_ASPCL|nr:flavodoxin and radical SAM domain protein [Aspergillus clavatus NRRL 1]EAW06823.1 flavodoxin and radical SAM domain protein [Aspergillus clavatus NRRL 1]